MTKSCTMCCSSNKASSESLRSQASIVARLVAHMVSCGIPSSEIGVICFFRWAVPLALFFIALMVTLG